MESRACKKRKSKTENEKERTREKREGKLIQVILIICDAHNSFARIQHVKAAQLTCNVELAICKITYSHLHTLVLTQIVYVHKVICQNFSKAHIIINLQNSVGILNRR